jgi:hypothetical protein
LATVVPTVPVKVVVDPNPGDSSAPSQLIVIHPS